MHFAREIHSIMNIVEKNLLYELIEKDIEITPPGIPIEQKYYIGFFDNDKFYNFREMCAIKEINVPIIAGIMPITNANQIKRSLELSNASLPAKFNKIMERFGENPDAMKQAGIVYATEQIIDLMANGVNNIHIYTMNKPDVAHQIMEGLSAIINE